MRGKARRTAGRFVNPLLKRELIGLLRTRRAFWLLVLLVAACSLLPLIVWPSQADSMAAIRGSGVFVAFTMTQLVVAVLITPAFTAGAIAGERERGTYELLYTSLLSPLAIISAKLLTSVGYILILLAASAPAVCVLYLQGGVDIQMVIGAYAITVMAVLSSGLVCLTTSMRSNRTLHAVIRGVFWVLLWQIGILAFTGLICLVIWRGDEPPEAALRFMLSVSPLPAMITLVDRVPFGRPYEFAYWYSAYAALLCAAHFVYLLIRVKVPDVAGRRLWFLRGRAGRPRPGVRRALFTRLLLRLGERDLPLLGNPVFVKELRSEFFSRPWFRRLATFGSLVVFGLIGVAGLPFGSKIGMIAIIAMILSALLISGALASSLPREIDQGNIDLLRVSLMPWWRILLGKAAAAVYGVWGILLAALLFLLALPFYGMIQPEFLTAHYYVPRGKVIRSDDVLELAGNLYLLTAVVGALHVAFLVAFSAFVTVICRRTLSALLGSLVSLLAIYLGIPLVIFAIVTASSGRGKVPDSDTISLYLGSSPFMTVAIGADELCMELTSDRNYRGRPDPHGMLVWFSSIYAPASLVFGGLAFALIRRRHERDR